MPPGLRRKIAEMTYYDILQVSENASDEVIRMAYKALAKQYHPDILQEDPHLAEQKMKEINEAYEILSDPQKRKEYDDSIRKCSYSNNSNNEQEGHHNTTKDSSASTNVSKKFKKDVKWLIIIAVLLFLVFSQTLQPYIQSSVDLYHTHAMIYGARDLALLCLIFCSVPLIVCLFVNSIPFIMCLGKAEPSTKAIHILCGVNSAVIFLLSMLLYIFEITPSISIGWIIALIYYFINTLLIRLFLHYTKRYGEKISRIAISGIWAIVLVLFISSMVQTNVIQDGNDTGAPITYDSYYVNIRSITISPDNNDSDHSWDEAEFTAEYLLEKWKSGEATEQSMVEIMDQYGSDQGGGKLHSVYPEDWIEEVDSWCFDRNRQVGDVAIIENVYGYTIVYFSGAVEIDN